MLIMAPLLNINIDYLLFWFCHVHFIVLLINFYQLFSYILWRLTVLMDKNAQLITPNSGQMRSHFTSAIHQGRCI